MTSYTIPVEARLDVALASLKTYMVSAHETFHMERMAPDTLAKLASFESCSNQLCEAGRDHLRLLKGDA